MAARARPGYAQVLARLEGRGSAPWQMPSDLYMHARGTSGRIEVRDAYALTAEKVAGLLPGLRGTMEVSWPSLVAQGFRIGLSSQRDVFTGDQHIVVEDMDGHAVGAFAEGDAFMLPQVRGLGLGAEMMLADSVLYGRGRRRGLLYSPAGHHAALASHRLSIRLAIEAGHTLPPWQEGAAHGGPVPG